MTTFGRTASGTGAFGGGTEIRVEPGAAVDVAALAAFQRAAFAAASPRMPGLPAAGALQSPAYYRWKYQAPAGPCRLAGAFRGDRRIAALAAVPARLADEDGRHILAWQLCDLATDPARRRQGLLRACFDALSDGLAAELGHPPPLFCLPNRHSLPALRRLGFAPAGEMRLFARPLWPTPARPMSAAPWQAEMGGPAFRAAASALCPAVDAADLVWRFASRPGHDYRLSRWQGEDGTAITASRRLRLFGLPTTMLMLLRGDTAAAEKGALAALAAEEAAAGARALLALAADRPAGAWLWPVPSVLLPRRFPIVARGIAIPGQGQPRLALAGADWDVL